MLDVNKLLVKVETVLNNTAGCGDKRQVRPMVAADESGAYVSVLVQGAVRKVDEIQAVLVGAGFTVEVNKDRVNLDPKDNVARLQEPSRDVLTAWVTAALKAASLDGRKVSVGPEASDPVDVEVKPSKGKEAAVKGTLEAEGFNVQLQPSTDPQAKVVYRVGYPVVLEGRIL